MRRSILLLATLLIAIITIVAQQYHNEGLSPKKRWNTDSFPEKDGMMNHKLVDKLPSAGSNSQLNVDIVKPRSGCNRNSNKWPFTFPIIIK